MGSAVESSSAAISGQQGARALPLLAVPYITAWSDEQPSHHQVIEHAESAGIGYPDETILDRDEHGVLWIRTPSRPGQGRPEFRRVHPLRQRRAMRRLLCQVCGRPADRDERGVLWLLRDHRGDWLDWPEGMANTYPPLCLLCVRGSVSTCPALRRSCVAVRSRRYPLSGVYGVQYLHDDPQPTMFGEVVVAYDDPAVRWVRATQQVRTLHDCTIVPLDGDTLSRSGS